MCMNGLLVVMAFGPLFGLWPSSFFVSSRDHGLRHFMLQKLVKNLQKRSTSKIYVQMRKRPIIGPRLGWLVILISNSCHYQS